MEVGGGWSLEGVGTGARSVQDAALPGEANQRITPLPALDTGALAPNGMLRAVEPRVTFFTPATFLGPPRGLPGAFTFAARFSWAEVPNQFSRTALVPAEDLGAPTDQGVDLEVGAGTRLGGAIFLGWALWVSESVMVTPELGGFVDVLQYETSLSTVPNDTLIRGGFEGGLGAMLRVNPWLFVRPRVSGRLGTDGGTGLFGGVGLSAGVGVLF